jgi:DNA invertase Pin-like site-specific DNA recombinase
MPRKAPPSWKAGRAATYVRMSTEFQQYSTENQAAVLEKYAKLHGLLIVKKFVDSGRSGVTIARRAGLRDLLLEVQSGNHDFDTILVYDVSRWGRFQDVDESAYYEYACKRAHVRIHYCAEPFSNDGTLYSTLIKTLKRSMAAEYSRELSTKVFAGQAHLIELGFHQGGHQGLGLRRQLVDSGGQRKQVLKVGERKSVQTDRVILIPGPKEEIETVREIFELFTVQLKTPGEIAKILNAREVCTTLGRAWTKDTVHHLLTNPKYIGSNVFNRISCKLGEGRKVNPAPMLIRRDGAFEAIVSEELFARAQEIARRRAEWKLADRYLLERLRALWTRAGKLSTTLIDNDKESPTTNTYRRHFGSLNQAYSLIGYQTPLNYTGETRGGVLKERRHNLCAEITSSLRANGVAVEELKTDRFLQVNGQFALSVYVAPSRPRVKGPYFWTLRLDNSIHLDLTIIARLKPGNHEVFDYLLIPDPDPGLKRLYLKERPGKLAAYCIDKLDDVLPGLFTRHPSWGKSVRR